MTPAAAVAMAILAYSKDHDPAFSMRGGFSQGIPQYAAHPTIQNVFDFLISNSNF